MVSPSIIFQSTNCVLKFEKDFINLSIKVLILNQFTSSTFLTILSK